VKRKGSSGFYPILMPFLLLLLAFSACSPLPDVAPSAAVLSPTVPASSSPTPTHIMPTATIISTETVKPTITKAPTITPLPTAIVAEHRIGIRTVDGVSEFYDRISGEKFIPRGFNYVRLAPMIGPNLWHSTLNPGFYNPERAESALQSMHTDGYNVVRIFIDCCRQGSNAGAPGRGISDTYIKNVVDFMNRAKANEIYVLMILDGTPAQGGYDELWRQCCEMFDGDNLRYLTTGGHAAKRRYDRDFIKALLEAGAPTEWIFAYDLTNEVSFSVDKAPFTLTSVTVMTANFAEYDMSSAEEKQRMMDENLVFWIDQQRAAILDVDSTALVSASFPAINTGRTTVNPAPAIYESSADFIDLHTYIGWGITLEQYMQRFGLTSVPEKPILMGEFGVTSRSFPDATAAAAGLVKWQAATCNYGFDGWLMWTWDTDESSDLYTATTDQGQISQALSPVFRPDPCKVGSLDSLQ
jgi:hypothetical protein